MAEVAVRASVSSSGAQDCNNVTWGVEQELCLFQQVIKLKPVGCCRQWKVMFIKQRMQSLLPGIKITSEAIWSKLSTMFDLQAIEEMEKGDEDDDQEHEILDFELPEDFYVSKVEPSPTNALALLPFTSSRGPSLPDKWSTLSMDESVVDIIKTTKKQRRKMLSMPMEPRSTRQRSLSLEQVLPLEWKQEVKVEDAEAKTPDAPPALPASSPKPEKPDDNEFPESKSAEQKKAPNKSKRQRKKSSGSAKQEPVDAIKVEPEEIKSEEIKPEAMVVKTENESGDELDPAMPFLQPIALDLPEAEDTTDAQDSREVTPAVLPVIKEPSPLRKQAKSKKGKGKKASNNSENSNGKDDIAPRTRAKRSTSNEIANDKKNRRN